MAGIEVDGFLADSVAAVQGKLYALGVGWNRIQVAMFPARHDRIAVGLLFRIPAGSPNESRRFDLRIEGPDGREIQLGTGADGQSVGRIGGDFTAGAAEEQIVPIALNLNGMPIGAPGDYRIVVSLNDADVKVLAFRVESLANAPSSDMATGTAGYL
jgi:uncharacterized protein DUF6941